jgi:hypothetical protein
MDPKKPFYKNPDDIRSEGLIGALYCSSNSKTVMMSWVIPIVENDELYLFISEFDNKPILVEYVINDAYRKMELTPRQFFYFKICNWNDARFLKILVNKESHLEYDLTKPEVRTRLMQNNFIERN